MSFIFFKVPQQDTVIQADITSQLKTGETVTGIVLGAPSPLSSNNPLFATLQTGADPAMGILLTGGSDGTSYGIVATVTTNVQVFLVTLAVTVATPAFTPYETKNPQAYRDLVDEIVAGEAALGTAYYTFPPGFDASGGFVTWELTANDGTVYAAGNAFSYTIKETGFGSVVRALNVINVPSTVPPTLLEQKYQLRYTLSLPQDKGLPPDPITGATGQNVFYQFESIRVIGLTTVPVGTEPQVELQGSPATLTLVTEKLWDTVTVELWNGNTQIAAPTKITEYTRTSNGWQWAGVFQTSELAVSLIPYSVIWRYSASTNTAMVYQERADLWIINPSILSAINDMKAKINKARTTLYGRPDMLYPEACCLTWLRRGMDGFNAAYGQFTSFDMTNAMGPIREYWLLCSEKGALEAEFLGAAEKEFNFQGAQISLDVDKTQYLDNMASKIQSQLDNELKPIKTNLITKGNISGDGSSGATANALAPGAIAAVGISITQASIWGSQTGNRWIRGLM